MKTISQYFRYLTLIIIFAVSVVAAMADGFTFQAVMRDTNGSLIQNGSVNFRLSILDESVSGNTVYSETQLATTNSNGVASLNIGNGEVVSGKISDIDWSIGKYYLKVEADRAGGTAYQLIATTEICDVPYAEYADATSEVAFVSDNGVQWNVSVTDDGLVSAKNSTPQPSAPAYGTVDYIFDLDAIPEVTIEVSTEQWNTLLSNYDLNSNNEECISVDFKWKKGDDVYTLENIGMRLRGNTSRVRPEGNSGESHNSVSPDYHHFHFGFKFQEYDKTLSFSGTDRMQFKWFKADPDYCREIFSYNLFRRFGVWTAPKASYCRLWLKIKEDAEPVYYGVYEMFEAIHDQFLADRAEKGLLDSDSGFLWKMGWANQEGAFLTKAQGENASLFGIEDVTLEYTHSFTYDYKSKKKKLPEATAQMQAFISDLNSKSGTELKQWIEENIDVDLLLRYFAVNTALGMRDDYWVNGNNFYMYFDTDGKMRFIPYDYDNSLGTSYNDNPCTTSVLQWGSGDKPLAQKLLSISSYKNTYISYLKQLTTDGAQLMGYNDAVARVKAWQDRITDYVSNDTGEDMTMRDAPSQYTKYQFYRLLTGNALAGNSGNANFFKSMKANVDKVAK